MKFAVPFNGDINLLQTLKSSVKDSLYEFYFIYHPEKKNINTLKNQQKSAFDPERYNEQIRQLMAFSQENNIRINMVLPGDTDLSEKDTLIEQIGALYENESLHTLTMGNELLLKSISFKELFPGIQLQNSVYLNIDSPEKAYYYATRGIDTLLITPDINKNRTLIKKIKAASGLPIKLLLNEGCLPFCHHKKTHNRIESIYHPDKNISGPEDGENIAAKAICHNVYNNNPKLLFQGNWIRPDKLSLYRGITDTFQIMGSIFTTENLNEILQSYLSGSLKGDLRNFVENYKYFKYPINAELLNEDHQEHITECKKPTESCDTCTGILKEVLGV